MFPLDKPILIFIRIVMNRHECHTPIFTQKTVFHLLKNKNKTLKSPKLIHVYEANFEKNVLCVQECNMVIKI